MCGSCSAAPTRHWSAPFLATVPARSSAAGAVTAMVRRAGARVTVHGTGCGYTVETATGSRGLAADLGDVWGRLRELRAVDDEAVPQPVAHLPSAGPATLPPPGARIPAGTCACPRRATPLGGTATPGRRHRFPAVLAWLAAVDGRGPRRLGLRLGLTAEVDAVVDVVGGSVVRCAAVRPTAPARSWVDLDDPHGPFAAALDVLLGPFPATPRRRDRPEGTPAGAPRHPVERDCGVPEHRDPAPPPGV